VGSALAKRNPELAKTSWAAGSVAPANVRKSEETLERNVSAYLGATRVLWLDVPDDPGPTSDRAYLERNSIGTLSRYCILHPMISASWLGTYSRNQKIALSGLWNLDHLFRKPHRCFIDILAVYIDAALGRNAAPMRAIAPKEWYAASGRTDSGQLSLFSNDSIKVTD